MSEASGDGGKKPPEGLGDALPRARDVRVRIVVHRDGHVERVPNVYCFRRERAVSLEQCTECERCSGLYFDPIEKRSMVVCGYRPGTSELPTALPPHFRTGDDAAQKTPISALMRREVVCVRDDMSVASLTALLMDRAIGGVPVVDAEGRPIGIVTKTDILRAETLVDDIHEMALVPGESGIDHAPGFHEEREVVATVRDIMTPTSFSLVQDAPVAQAAAIMAFEGIHRLPVTSEPTGEVVGLISSTDVLRWIAQRSGFLVPEGPAGRGRKHE